MGGRLVCAYCKKDDMYDLMKENDITLAADEVDKTENVKASSQREIEGSMQHLYTTQNQTNGNFFHDVSYKLKYSFAL